MDRDGFRRWLDGYERAWRRPGAELLRDLFAASAAYRHSPYAEPLRGLPAIERDWEAERDGPDEVFTMLATVLAVEGEVGVAHVLVRYGEPLRQEYQDLWLVWFDADGRASRFEEWPFWPDQPWAAGGSVPSMTSDAASDSAADRESDVEDDGAVANSRETGGDPAADGEDAGGTTGTGESEEFVGRVSGQDAGYEAETGAEARAAERS